MAEEVSPFADPLFQLIRRPDERLLTVRIEVEGDSSGGVHLEWAAGLSDQQRLELVLYVADQLRDAAASSRRSAGRGWGPTG